MHQTQLSQSLLDHLDQGIADETVGSFVEAIHDWAVTRGKQIHDAIDTPEERAAIESVIGSKFDELVGNHLNQTIARYVRMGALAAVDALLITVSGVSAAAGG